MKNHKNADIYDFSDYAEEITGDALFKINGGAEVENSHEGVANAQVGDKIKRNSGEVVVLKQADIDYAQQQLGTYGNQETNNTSTGTQNYSGGSNQTTSENHPTISIDLQSIPENIRNNPQALAAYMAKQGQAKAEGNPDRYKGYNVLGTKSNKTESPSADVVKEKPLSPVFVKAMNILYKLFIDDGKEDIFTLGVSASGTVTSVSGATGAGVYINPKSDLRLFSSLLLIPVIPKGLKTVALTNSIISNMEDFGVYASLETGGGIGQSGSVSVSVGNFKSLEDAKGAYIDYGVSYSPDGISIGFDLFQNLKKDIIGETISVGLGAGGLLESHTRIGFTGIQSFVSEN